MSTLQYIVIVSIVIAIIVTDGEGLMIRELVVPPAVPSDGQSAVILDCDYILEKSSSEGLVVKWYFNNYPNPVYQWILGRKPQDLGVLKKRVNLDYKASMDETMMYRAIKIESPTKELSGVYKCHVSTFFDEAAKEKKMVVYTPAKRLDLKQENKGEDVTLRCVGIGVYPEPNMTISSSEKEKTFPVSVETISKDGLYNIEAMITFKNKDLQNPTTFDCILNVAEANYTLQKSMYYYPAPPTTPAPYTSTTVRYYWGLVDSMLPKQHDTDIFSTRAGNSGSWTQSHLFLLFTMTLFAVWL